MVWAGMCEKGKTGLFICDQNVNSQYYTQILTKTLLPFAKKHYKKDFIFQHDNSSVHTSNHTKEYLAKKKIQTLDWPSKSPDLNPIENLWGNLARKLYDNGKKQFDTKEDLRKALFKTWKEIEIDECKELTDSMTTRLIKVVRKGGKQIDY